MSRFYLFTLLSAFSFLLLSCDSASNQTGSDTPKGEHQSSMVVQLHRPKYLIPSLPSHSPNFIADQIAVFTTGNVLDLASEKSNIDAKLIKESLVIDAIEGTDLVRLTAYNDDASLAKITVESLVEAYQEIRKQQWQDQAAKSLEALDQELQDQGDLVQDYRKALTVLIQQYGIPVFEARSSKTIGQAEEAMYRKAQEKLDQLEKNRTQLGIAARKLREAPEEDQTIETLNQELHEQKNLVQEYRKTLTDLIQKRGVSHGDGRGALSIEQAEDAMYRRAQEKLDQLEQDRNHLQIQIRKLIDTPNDDLIRTAAGLELPENQVTIYYTAYRAAGEQVSAMIASGLGESHPKVEAMKRRMEKTLENAGKEVISLKKVLETRLNLVEKQIEKMSQMVRERGDQPVDRSMQQNPYSTAKEEYEQARIMYREMSVKQQELRVFLKMPRTFITIHERAK